MSYYQDTDTNTSIDYLGENLLADAIPAARPVIPSTTNPYFAPTRARILEPAPGGSDDTRLVIAIDYGTTFTGKMSHPNRIPDHLANGN